MTSLVKIHHAITAHGHCLSLQSVTSPRPAPGAAPDAATAGSTLTLQPPSWCWDNANAPSRAHGVRHLMGNTGRGGKIKKIIKKNPKTTFTDPCGLAHRDIDVKEGLPPPRVRGNSAPERVEHKPLAAILIHTRKPNEMRTYRRGGGRGGGSSPSSWMCFAPPLTLKYSGDGGERGIHPPSKQVEDLQRLANRWRCVKYTCDGR